VSQVEKGRINKANLISYIKLVEKSKEGFPVNQFGEVNLNLIAKKCGFNRGVFAKNKTMAGLLDVSVKKVGLKGGTNKPAASDFLSNKVSEVEKTMGKLRKSNAVKSEEITALRHQTVILEAENTRLKNMASEDSESFDEMIRTGRRFTL